MARKHGITANTYKYFAIDQAAVYENYGSGSERLLGATKGGNSFTVEQDLRTMEVDGAKGPVKGDKRITGVRAIITANFIELNKYVLQRAFPGSTVSDYPSTAAKTHDKVSRSLQIRADDYIDNVAIVGECTGSPTGNIVCLILNAIATDNIEMAWNPNDESVIPIKFTGHFLPSDLDTEPWEIRFPVIA